MKTLTIRTAFALLAGVLVAGAPRPSVGQTGPPYCAARDTIADLLKREYGEELRFRATEEGGSVIEFYVAPSGTWTMLVTRGSFGCVGGSGTQWTEIGAKTAARSALRL